MRTGDHGSSPGMFQEMPALSAVCSREIWALAHVSNALPAPFSPSIPGAALAAALCRCCCCQASGRGARTLSRYVLAGLVPMCLLAALVLDRAGERVPAALLSKNPALQAAADLERAGESPPPAPRRPASCRISQQQQQ